MYIQLYAVGHCSQSSDGQRNLSSNANRGVSTFRRSLDSVDSSGDKTTIIAIPTVGVYSSIVYATEHRYTNIKFLEAIPQTSSIATNVTKLPSQKMADTSKDDLTSCY